MGQQPLQESSGEMGDLPEIDAGEYEAARRDPRIAALLAAAATEHVEVVPRSEAEALAEALENTEAVLKRAQTYIGLLRQYDEQIPHMVAGAREDANKVSAAYRARHPKETP